MRTPQRSLPRKHSRTHTHAHAHAHTKQNRKFLQFLQAGTSTGGPVRRSPLIRPYQRISMHDATSKLVLCPPPSDAMSTAGPPLCPCGLRVVAPSRSLGIRERWAEDEGISWSWVSSSTRGGASVAYFRFCAECHTKTWPDDKRPPNGNRWTRPASRLMPTFQSSLHVLCTVTKCQGCGFVGGRPHKAK